MATKFDPLLNQLRVKDNIPEYTSDPSSPGQSDAWVLKSAGILIGNPIGLLLSLTYAGNYGGTFQLSYRTSDNTIVRTTLS